MAPSPDENVSFTEKEIPICSLERNAGTGVPTRRAGKDRAWQVRHRAKPGGKAQKHFVTDFPLDSWFKQWRTVSELCSEVLISLVNESNRRPGIGWVRGDQAIDPKVLQEAERLRIENAELKVRLAQASTDEVTFPIHLEGPDSELPFSVVVKRYEPVATENTDKSRTVVSSTTEIVRFLP